MAKRIVTRKVTGVGWDGNLHVRVDLAPVDPGTGKPKMAHIYVEPDDPIAGLGENTEVVIVAGTGLVEALRAAPVAQRVAARGRPAASKK